MIDADLAASTPSQSPLPARSLILAGLLLLAAVGGGAVGAFLTGGAIEAHAGEADAERVRATNFPSVAGTTPTDVIQARRLEVVDDRGEVRVLLEASGNRPGLILYGADGKVRATLTAGADGVSMLSLADAVGTPRAMLMVFPDGPSLMLSDTSGKTRAGLGVGGDGVPKLDLLDNSREIRASLSLNDKGTPSLSLNDAAGTAILAVFPDGTPALGLTDAAGRERTVSP